MADNATMKPIRLIPIACLVPVLAACMADGPGLGSAAPNAQPALSTWRCDGGGTMTVRRTGDSIEVRSPRGVDVTLPASPPGSRERYGEGLYAVVFNGREALWFVTGKPPLNCRR
ncbi:MAG: hypothetical protein CMJ42_21235 [Phyllobacteriaceae bacterium]|nr:hypothetical protein [Phyllobacteriaceae bacterium]MBA90861.1 hypothetical protein [Phyllobacteriaceae bacterium]